MRWRWPWIARSEYERLWQEREDTVHDLTARAERAEALNEKLIDQLVSMKRDHGFSITVPAQPREPQPPRAADEAIEERAATQPALRRYLIQWANGQRRQGVEESEIAEQIRNWSNGEGDED